MLRNCKYCALKNLKNGTCPIFDEKMEDELGCPYFTTNLDVCDVCGNPFLKGGYLQEENGVYHMMCGNCATGNPCKTCTHSQQCRFQTDQSCSEPPYIMVQQRQGNMIMQTQQLNIKRVQATCARGCVCFREKGLEDELFCWRQIGCGCNNLKVNWRN